jgi:L-lysine 2,3-aminomutase
MITASPGTRQNSTALSWQQQMAGAITRVADLAAALDLDPGQLGAHDAARSAFPLRVPWSYVARMRRGDPRDPLLLQVLPVTAELDEVDGFDGDPLEERAALSAPGLLHKYRGRALIVTTAACAVHCRYCFRREFPYTDSATEPRWNAALAAIADDPGIEEVILSGGDPLSLGNARLAALSQALAPIPHVRRLRVHTRQPIVLPARVDAGLTAWLARQPWPTTIVLHANHPSEIDFEVREACARLRGTGALLLNQSVLLRGVNDSVETLAELSAKLIEAGVLPYYLHVLDRVRGAAHFEVSEDTARHLAGELAARLSGYLVPRLVREIPGAPAKIGLPPALPGM